MHELLTFYESFCVILGFTCFWIDTRPLARSLICFLVKQSETCQQKILLENQNCLRHMQHLRIAALYLTSDQFIAISDDILCYLEFSGFGIITRCLVGSQIFFLDKQSETCRKKFQL